MSIDTSGPLHRLLNKSKEQYHQALENGDIELAKLKANECARILKQLARTDKNFKQRYLERADEWIKRAEKSYERKKLKMREKFEEDTKDPSEEFSSLISSLITKSKVTWDDIGGLTEVTNLLKVNTAISAMKKPICIKPWHGILLFGPPGTGKTLLASAAAGTLKTTFFNLKVDKVLSKYFGESSKIISFLYDTARNLNPSIVFIDEFDDIASSRDREKSEASNRILNTVLTELDGMKDKKSDKYILTLAATNHPWLLDQAILSRFIIRIYVPLPDLETCKKILKIHLKGLDISNLNLDNLAKTCIDNKYSGRDIAAFTQSAMWKMIHEKNKNLSKLADLSYKQLVKKSLQVGPIKMSHFQDASINVKSPLTNEDIERFEQWGNKYGAKGY